ncbi:MAG: FHA domain-containing protein [Candidatus Melainabacteria bacterium]|nr:FHA domain-containing protein [Candidatus Melainabacteria bacterium]
MGDTGKPADTTGTDSTKKAVDPVEATRTDKTSTSLESTPSGDSALSPIAQIAVDNQAATLPGTKAPEKGAVDAQGNLQFSPLPGTETTTADAQPKEAAAKEATEKDGTPKSAEAEKTATVPVLAPGDPQATPRATELANLPSANTYRDGRSDAIDLTVRRIHQLPAEDPARQLVMRELAEKFETGKTYAERLQAAKALIFLTKGPDGKVPDVVAMRDVSIAEKSHMVGRGSNAKLVVDVKAHHELRPLAAADVLKFVNNSAETIEQQVKALKDQPADDKNRHNLQQKLTLIFQTHGEDTPEKLAAAKGLLDLNRKADGTLPDLLGTRTVEHAKVTKRGRHNTVETVSEARTEVVNTTRSDVEKFIGRHSDGLIADTALIAAGRERLANQLAKPAESKPADTKPGETPPGTKPVEGNPPTDATSATPATDATTGAEDAQRRTDLYNRSVHIFLDSKNPEDKTAAAIALIELRTGVNGQIGDELGSRHVHDKAKIEPAKRGQPAREIAPARDWIQTIPKKDVLTYLQTQLDPSTASPRGRIMAADALKQAGAIDDTRYKDVVRGVLSDDRAPEALKVELRKTSGLEHKQEELKLASDGRVIGAKPEDYVQISNENGQRDRLQVTLDRLAQTPQFKDLVSAKQIEEMNRELKEGTFGPASRDFYNKSATLLNGLTTDLSVAITSRNGTLPEGNPITVPKDNSGRAIGDDLFRAQLLTGRLQMDLKTLKPGELPEGERLTETAQWTGKAFKEYDNMRLKWEVSVFDDRLTAFNKNGKLDAWMSNDKMSLDQMRELQSARGEWLQLGMQVRNYTHAIHYFNKATADASNIPRLSISQAEVAVFSDDALNDKNFPGKVIRENGKIKSVEIDLPETLDRSDPANIEKVAKLRSWLEKYGPKVDQLTDEIKQASIDQGRLLMWGDIEHEGVDELTKKHYNFTALRFDTERVMVKMPDGTQEERIRVTSSKQHKYAGNLSLYKTVGDIEDVGNPVTSGEIKVNGKVIPLDAGNDGVTIGSEGTIKVTGGQVEADHARMRVAEDGRVFIKDNGSKNGTYVSGKLIDSQKWVEVFPDQNVTLGEPPASLAIGKNENGEPTFNGQTLKVGEPTDLGTIAGTTIEGAEKSVVKVEADGRMFIKDTGSEKGTYVNGRKVDGEKWTQISASDKVTFGAPAASLDIEGDVRLYKPGAMVTVLVDGQMQLMPAENLKAWGDEAAGWHYTGKGAMALMDLGMIVTGTIEFKGLHMAAMQGLKETGKLGARTVFSQMVHTPGFARAAWHAGLGATGLVHQSIENTGPYGKKFMELRGYAMMADIFYGSVVKDGLSISRKAFGMAKPAEQGSAVANYLKTAPWAKTASSITEKMFLGMNGYFVAEIGAHQIPAIVGSIRKHDAATLLNGGMLLRAGQYESNADKDAPPLPTLEDQARKFASPDGREKMSQVQKEAADMAKLPEEKSKEKEQYLAKLTSQFLDSPNKDDKLAAAFGLLTYHAQDSKSVPNILGTRYKSQNDLPENVTAANVKAYIDSRIPPSINMFDKQLQTAVENRFAKISEIAAQPSDSPDRKQLNNQLLSEFTSATGEKERVAAAMGLMLLNEKDGKVPDLLGTTTGADGEQVEVKAEDLRNLLTSYQSHTLMDRFDSYTALMKGNESLNTILGKTRELIAASDNAEARKEESIRLQAIFEKSENREEKAAAALGLIFLNADPITGAFADTLAQTTYQVEVPRLTVATSTGPYSGYHNAGGIGRMQMVKEDRVRDLKSADVMQYLKGNMPTLAPGTRLAMGDLLYRADESPMAGQSKFNDYAGLLLSVVQDKNASPEARKEALVNAHGLGLAEAMEVHRFSTEPGIGKLESTIAATAEADIYGRDSRAIEKALLDIVAQPTADKDLRALASATLLANSETDPAKRKALLTQMQTEYEAAKGTPGAYYDRVFQRESQVVKTSGQDGEPSAEDRAKLFRAAVIMSKNNNWKDFGVSDQQMALAMESSFTLEQPVLASHALEPLLKHYKDLDADGRGLVEYNLLSLLKDNQGGVNSPGYLLKLDVINKLDQINAVLGPQFAAKARQEIGEVLTPGTVPNKVADEETRAAIVRALGKTSANDLATQDLLKQIIGAGDQPGDSSALVRSTALDRLSELKPVGLNQIAAGLLETEKDPEVLRKLGQIELTSRRLDPDSAEYRERFRQSLNKLMASGANKYSLAEVPDFIRKNYPMLEWTHMFNTASKRAADANGKWVWAWEKTGDLMKPHLDQAKGETSGQLDAIISKAARPEGDMERRTLAWIVMSNGRFFDESTKQEAVQRAANGLLNASLGDAQTKAAVAPLLEMAIATQDRMPYSARTTLVTALVNLNPGAPGSPVSREDAGVALLAGLKRQFERTPRDGNDPNYKASHELQMKLLDAYSKYASVESIPILEAMAADQSKVGIVRDTAERVKDIAYPDKSGRSVDYDENNEVWKLTTTRGGVKQTLVRQGKSDEWYEESDATKTTVWRGKVAVDQTNASIRLNDSFGKSLTHTADGGTVQRTGTKVEKVTYPDGSSREISDTREEITNAKGVKEIWTLRGDLWHTDTDARNRGPWKGTLRFDEAGNFVQVSANGEKKIIRPDGSNIFYKGDQATYSTPSSSDHSAHSMPLIRDRAKQLLGELQDSTDVLLRGLKLDGESTPQQLADNLTAIAASRDNNSEAVARAVLVAGLSKPLTGADDPRRAVLHQLLKDPHERISMAAARVLLTSGASDTPQQGAEFEQRKAVADQDRRLAATVIADIAKNGSKQGFRDDANRLIAEIKQQAATPGSARVADAQLLEAALLNTKSAPRVDTGRFAAPHTIDQQEKYERATGALIRDNLITLDRLEKPEWWSEHGYKLLEAGSYVNSQYETADNVSFSFFEKIKARFDYSDVEKKFKTAFENLNSQRDEQIKLLTDRAMANDDSESAQDARKALAFIVLSNGYPLSENIRNRTVYDAAKTLATIYKNGGPGAAYAEQIVTDVLIANPGIDISVRSIFAQAVIQREGSDQSRKGDASSAKAALLLTNALDAETWAMPTRGQPRYQESINFQNMILGRLDKLGESISMPVLEAMSKGHPDQDLKRRADEMFNRLKDGIGDLFSNTVPDTTTDRAELAKSINELLNRKDTPRTDEDLVRELVRMAHPKTFDVASAADDPRIPVLRTALTHANDRVRLAAAVSLTQAGDPRGVVALSQLQDSSRAGIKREANLNYEGTFMMRFALPKLTADGDAFVRQTLNDASGQRAKIAAARVLVADQPGDAAAAEAIVNLYGAQGGAFKAEAEQVIKEIIEKQPIAKADDPRRAILETQLRSPDQKTQVAAAWLLAHSSVEGDIQKAVAVLGKLAVKSEAKTEAQSLLKDMIARGSDAHQLLALKTWNDAWVANGSPEADKPAFPTSLEQTRKYFRTASVAERAQIFALPEAEKKALIMQLSGKSEQELEDGMQPAPLADFRVPREVFDPLKVFNGRPELLFPLPGTDRWSTGGDSFLRPLATRWSPATNDGWERRLPANTGLRNWDSAPQPYFKATTDGVAAYNTTRGARVLGTASKFQLGEGQTQFVRVDAPDATAFLNLDQSRPSEFSKKDSATFARLSMANQLQQQAQTGDVIKIGLDGKLVLQFEGHVTTGDQLPGNGRQPHLTLGAMDDRKPFALDGTGDTPPEFSDFLEYLQKQRPEIMQQPSIKASDLSVMFLQYLRQREAGIESGYVITPSLFDRNVDLLANNPSALPWYPQKDNRGYRNQPQQWSEVQGERERLRAAKLDEQLTKLLVTVDARGREVKDHGYSLPGAHWQPAGAVEIGKPELLTRPPVENLQVNRLGLTNILPSALLGKPRTEAVRVQLWRTGDNTTSFTPTASVVQPDVEISTALLDANLWKARQQLNDKLVIDRMVVLRTPENNPGVSSFALSPASQELLRRYQQVKLQERIRIINNWESP